MSRIDSMWWRAAGTAFRSSVKTSPSPLLPGEVLSPGEEPKDILLVVLVPLLDFPPTADRLEGFKPFMRLPASRAFPSIPSPPPPGLLRAAPNAAGRAACSQV